MGHDLKPSKPKAGRRPHSRVTISDVAKHAGVSPMTVSRVMNGETNVREATRTAVNEAIELLGYAPNKAARSLASGHQLQIGLLYDNPSSTYLSAMLLGLLDQARQSDTQIVVVECQTESDGIEALHSMVKGGVDGIILSPPLCDSRKVLDLLERTRTLAVMVGSQYDDRRISSVCIDEYMAARAMTEHIISLGHKRIGFITGSPDQTASQGRFLGYRDALSAHGVAHDDALVAEGWFTYRSGLNAAEKLLRLADRPTAIFASNDEMAAAAVAVAHRRRIEIPGELTICGFDDTLLATTVWPEITTIHQPIDAMAHAAVELLAKGIRQRRAGEDVECHHLILDYRLIRRESDGPPAVKVRRARGSTSVVADPPPS